MAKRRTAAAVNAAGWDEPLTKNRARYLPHEQARLVGSDLTANVDATMPPERTKRPGGRRVRLTEDGQRRG